MRKLTHKTHKIVPCKWNNWHNVSIRISYDGINTRSPRFFICCSFLLKAYFTIVCPHVIYLRVLFVDNETRVVLISVTRGQMSADCDMSHPLHFTRNYLGSCSHNHYTAPLYSCLGPPQPHGASNIYIIINTHSNQCQRFLGLWIWGWNVHSVYDWGMRHVSSVINISKCKWDFMKCILSERVNH